MIFYLLINIVFYCYIDDSKNTNTELVDLEEEYPEDSETYYEDYNYTNDENMEYSQYSNDGKEGKVCQVLIKKSNIWILGTMIQQSSNTVKIGTELIQRFSSAWRCGICEKICSTRKSTIEHLKDVHKISKLNWIKFQCLSAFLLNTNIFVGCYISPLII